MFGFKKKEKEPMIITEQQPEEMMDLKEFVSVDSVKSHLVDILEENARLKKSIETNREAKRER